MPDTASDVAPLRTGTGAGARATTGNANTGAAVISAAADLSNEERTERLEELFRTKAAVEGEIAAHLGEVERSQSFRDEGATSTERWVTERFGVSTSTARSLTHVAELASDLPHLLGALCEGTISFDKLRAVVDVAKPETDRELREQARQCSVRELADVARSTATRTDSPARSQSNHARRFLRFNDQFRTMTVQLPAESYAEARACLESRARQAPSDRETPWDQRLCDAFREIIRSSAPGSSAAANPYIVVLHTALATLVDEAGEERVLAGELERGGLIDGETVRRIACDATIAIGVDDDVGHTMYEGRARRWPSASQRREIMRRDRHCRFPGCTNVTFTNVHHIVPWKPDGRTDLDNLALLCEHHHHRVHSKQWAMSGNPNEELKFVGPTGRVMTSRPSPLWTRVTAGARAGSAPAPAGRGRRATAS